MKQITWDDGFLGLVWLAALSAIVLVVTSLVSPRTLNGYYIGEGQYRDKGICIMASIAWYTDERAYCSDDIDKVIRVYEHIMMTTKSTAHPPI